MERSSHLAGSRSRNLSPLLGEFLSNVQKVLMSLKLFGGVLSGLYCVCNLFFLYFGSCLQPIYFIILLLVCFEVYCNFVMYHVARFRDSQLVFGPMVLTFGFLFSFLFSLLVICNLL